jgi:iron complex transport system ATP-binding protein
MVNQLLQIEDVEVCFGNTTVLEGISFNVNKGEFIAIIGPNGSGKTTLLRTIAGLLKPRKGRLSLNGIGLQNIKSKELAKSIAVVPQNINMNFAFTALEVVLMGRNPHLKRFQQEGKRDIEIARKAMELTKTLHLANRRIDQVSGGEKQRIIIARALAQEPKLLLLDEPTSNLDISYRIEIMELLKQLTQGDTPIAVVAAIHDLNLAAQYCSKLILLDHGRIVSSGCVEEVLTTENIKKVFHVSVVIGKHPISRLPYITPISQVKRFSSGKKIHIICGGGTGAPLMHSLLQRGYIVSTGVLNVLDSDYEAAVHLGIEIAIEAPFSYITDEAFAANLELIKNSDAVLLANIPFGRANLKNLEACEIALKLRKPVIIVEESPVEARDFTAGEATRKMAQLKNAGAKNAKNHAEAIEIIENLKSF